MKMIDKEAISLFDLNRRIREVLYEGFPMTTWIIAEISELNENRSGHCYLELVDKNPLDDSIRAISRATIWASRYRMIKPYFETTTGQALTSGIKVMVSVKVEFHERYGFSLNILDIEPSFTLGELARKRIEILKRLEKDGVIGMNRELECPLVLQKIAIISSETAAGYGDFIDQLHTNHAGYKFYTRLYQAAMQGSDTGNSIIKALDRIAENESFFDAVVIIRGGGAKTDLTSFDDYELGYYVTQFPLPVIAGIGHERDESVVDIVAHTSCKTPTAVAEYLIQLADSFSSELDELRRSIVDNSRGKLSDWKDHLSDVLHNIKQGVDSLIKREWMDLRETAIRGSSSTQRFIYQLQMRLNTKKLHFQTETKRYIESKQSTLIKDLDKNSNIVRKIILQEKNRLILFSKEADLQDPARILKKGYSITLAKGKAIKYPDEIEPGEDITTRLFAGNIKSKVLSKMNDSTTIRYKK